MQKWALLLAAYQYDIVYRSTTKHPNADCLKIDKPTEAIEEVKQINLQQIKSLPFKGRPSA